MREAGGVGRMAVWAAAGAIFWGLGATPAFGQLRVANWNISFYSGGRISEIQTAVYGVFQGRSMSPDVLICQEFISQSAVNAMVNILNNAPGSPGDWAAAPFINGPDTDNAFFYRISKIQFLSVTTISFGGPSPEPPRNTERYNVRLRGYVSNGAVLACYSSHMKSQESGTDDDNRRLLEAQRIRDDAEQLNPNYHFLLGGDFNIQTSSEAAYVELVGSQPNNAGRFFDPIRTPGNWNNNFAFRFVHTQDPAGPGGMDDRHDQILVCDRLIDGDGFDYIGNPNIAYSTTTWNDPNHSYRAWGNDGTSYNTTLTVNGNTMVGATIAQALIDVTNGAGHLPVFLDFRVPPHVASETLLDFGQVPQNAPAQQTLNVANDADVALWNAAGIAPLNYSMTTTAGFSAPGGSFSDPAGGGGNSHMIAMDTSMPGMLSGTLTILSNAPDQPSRNVTLIGEVIAACGPADVNCDGQADGDDVAPFFNLLLGVGTPCSACAGDMNGDGEIDADDIQDFVSTIVMP